MNPKVDWYFTKNEKWQEEIKKLRSIILDCGLTEELKWGCPCYTSEEGNIVLIHVFKDYCALLFFKGVLLKDPDHVLVQQTENVQVARQMRFAGLKDVTKMRTVIKAFINEANEVKRSGMKVPLKKTKKFEYFLLKKFIKYKTKKHKNEIFFSSQIWGVTKRATAVIIFRPLPTKSPPLCA